MKNFFSLLMYDLRLSVRNNTEWASLILFFAIMIILLPFALGPEPELLKRLAPGLIWLAALLMVLLSLDRFFIQDLRDGTLDTMLLSALPLPLIVLSKLSAQTLVIFISLMIMLLPAALLLNMNVAVLPVLAVTFFMGIPSLVLLGGIMACISISLQRNAALMMILLSPFYIPVLIFAVGACDSVAMGVSAQSNILLLSAILVFLLPTTPFIISATLRQGL